MEHYLLFIVIVSVVVTQSYINHRLCLRIKQCKKKGVIYESDRLAAKQETSEVL
jgi:hypothetical protein